MLYYKLGELPAKLPESLEVQRTGIVTKMVTLVTDENGIEETIEREETFTEVFTEVISPPYSEEDITLSGYKPVPDQPEYDPIWHRCVWGGKEWKLIASKKAIHREVKWIRIRKHRNFLLTITDDLIRQFMENNESVSEEWASYRSALRDIPNTYETGNIDDVDAVVWPDAPSQFNQTLYEDLLNTINDDSVSENIRSNTQIKYDLLIAVKWHQLKNYENGIEDSTLNEYIN